MLHGRQYSTIQDVKEYLSSKEITKKLETKGSKGLTTKGRTEKRDSRKKRKMGELNPRIRI